MAKYHDSEVKDRLKNFIAYHNISIRSFQEAANLSNSFVASIDQSIAPKTQKKIQAAFPDLNMAWLLTGEGDMLRPAQTTINGNNNVLGNHNNVGNNISVTKTTSKEKTNYEKPIVPKYLSSQPNIDVYKMLQNDGHTMQLDSMTAIPPYNEFDFYYMVRQDAMKPLYKEGDVLALAHTERGSDIVQGASMIIDTNDFGFLLRRIYDRGDYYECRIINENSSFETQNIAKTKVIRLYRIVYSIRLGD